jgi:hypothetical protein
VPAADQVCGGAVAVPFGSGTGATHTTGVPSLKSNPYSISLGRLSVDPPAVYVYARFIHPLVGPVSVFGGKTVSTCWDTVTGRDGEVPETTEVFKAERACTVMEYVFAVDH